MPDPAACFEKLGGWSHRVWLDSGSDAGRLGRYSFLSADPSLVIEAEGHRAFCTAVREGGTREALDGDALGALRDAIAPFRAEPVPGIPPFQGGLIGYVGYEFGGTLEKLAAPPGDGLGIPDLVFGLYDWTLAWDHLEGRAWLISTGIPERGEARRHRADARMQQVLERLQSLGAGEGIMPAPDASTALPAAAPRPRSAELSSSLSHAEYLAVVRRVREYILAGDVYQANITQRFRMPIDEEPVTLYGRLRAQNPAPFSAFLEFGELSIASVSPERFLRLTSEGHVEARPIKGTRPRGSTADDDDELARELLHSEKDRAEHVMIVDLMRNDLSRVCRTGSVRVPELFALEKYATVHHLVSTVTGELRPGCDAIDLLRATFPGGSITGAPKIRAMEIIAELEPVRRDVYCGTIAYLGCSGAMDASIVIRTALIKDGEAYCSAGGGIVADSEPEAEYVESWNKARGLLDVLGASLPAGYGA